MTCDYDVKSYIYQAARTGQFSFRHEIIKKKELNQQDTVVKKPWNLSKLAQGDSMQRQG